MLVYVTWVRPAIRENVAVELLRKNWKNILERSSDEVDDILRGPVVIAEDKRKTYPFQILPVAAEMGNTKFLVELIRAYPDISFTLNDDKHSIFHIAVSHRHESIYNLLYEMDSVHDILSAFKDKHDNNMLHLVGMEAKSPFKDVPGGAFQMQRELLWFESNEEKNDAGRTPLQLFIENHQDMVSEGEKWMKETTNQCMVVVALITTIVFSVAFTIPDGYDQNNGLPIFLKDVPFIAFFVLYRNKLISLPIIISVGVVVPIYLYIRMQCPLLVDVYGSTYGSRSALVKGTRLMGNHQLLFRVIEGKAGFNGYSIDSVTEVYEDQLTKKHQESLQERVAFVDPFDKPKVAEVFAEEIAKQHQEWLIRAIFIDEMAKQHQEHIVEHLVDRMTEQQLVLQDKYGSNVLFDVAAVGTSIWQGLWLKNCALKILDDTNQIRFPQQEYAREILYTLARKTSAFKDIKSGKITWVRPAIRENVAVELLRKIWKNILERSSDEVDEILRGPVVIAEDKRKTYPFQILPVAAEMGNTKFLVELIRAYSDISFTLNDDKHSIFHIAVSHRHESIYNLLYEMDSVHDILSAFKDKHDNNMLHLVGMKAKSPLKDVSGGAFQMQRELLWFESREEKNDAGRTPLQIFIENHQDMVSEGEKWMKETTNQCMVVVALITTIVFSVAFTIPGGYDQNNGLPIFLKDGPFIAFVILDAISLILSSASILMFLSILTSRYTYHDFRISLPTKLMIGLRTLFLSIITMVVTFSFSFFVLYRNKLISLPIIISVGVVVPIYLYIRMQCPLLVDVYGSTYGSRYLFRPKKPVLFYHNLRF
ncbi:hypothetical protein L6452_09051 [Arctium lappa]|uniref:Uncharacterized protein n=1 Tax=Arctium lappa TaxID=4217 RepID=A0ACB9DIZ1_ARCLA|nr:hypothetical protein L6452_09051 [Arctium lappa]